MSVATTSTPTRRNCSAQNPVPEPTSTIERENVAMYSSTSRHGIAKLNSWMNASRVLNREISVSLGSSRQSKRVALVLPDIVGKLSLVRFEQVPAKAQDLDQLIRWQVRKAAPFKIEDAQIAWVPGMVLPGGGRDVTHREFVAKP